MFSTCKNCDHRSDLCTRDATSGALSSLYHKRDAEGDLEAAQDYLRKATDVSPILSPKLHSLFDREESRRIERLVEEEMEEEGL